MMTLLRVLFVAVVPSFLLLLAVRRLDRRREPWGWVGGTYALGALACVLTMVLLVRVAHGLDFDLGARGSRAGAFVFLFGVVAPVAELAKVAAAWPAFRSRQFDEPFDGLVYGAAASLGYAAVQLGAVLAADAGQGLMWTLRVLLALPAQLFFGVLWGYGLGRARSKRDPGPLFPLTWLGATVLHGFYIYLLAGRGEGALLFAVPLVVCMGIAAAIAARDLAVRSRQVEAPSATVSRGERVARSFDEVRAALRRAEAGPRVRWVGLGALTMVGGMLLGFVVSVVCGHLAHVDFAAFDENDIRTAAPLLLLASGSLAGMPVAGYLLAKASEPPNLVEPAMAALAAIVLVLVAFGLSGPTALVWGLSCSPIAWGFGCAGAWIGRVRRS